MPVQQLFTRNRCENLFGGKIKPKFQTFTKVKFKQHKADRRSKPADPLCDLYLLIKTQITRPMEKSGSICSHSETK